MQGPVILYQAHSLLPRSLQTSCPWMSGKEEVLMLQGPQASLFHARWYPESFWWILRGTNGPAHFLPVSPPTSLPLLIPVQPPCPSFCSTNTLSSAIPQGLWMPYCPCLRTPPRWVPYAGLCSNWLSVGRSLGTPMEKLCPAFPKVTPNPTVPLSLQSNNLYLQPLCPFICCFSVCHFTSLDFLKYFYFVVYF